MHFLAKVCLTTQCVNSHKGSYTYILVDPLHPLLYFYSFMNMSTAQTFKSLCSTSICACYRPTVSAIAQDIRVTAVHVYC